MRDKFRVGSKFKHYLGNDIGKTLRSGGRISKSNDIPVLFTDIKTPCFRSSENFPASRRQRLQEFSTDILLARDHHLGENGGPLRLGDALLPWIPFSCKTQRRIVYG